MTLLNCAVTASFSNKKDVSRLLDLAMWQVTHGCTLAQDRIDAIIMAAVCSVGSTLGKVACPGLQADARTACRSP